MFMNADQKVITTYNTAVVANNADVVACYKEAAAGGVPSLQRFVPPPCAEAYAASQRELQREAAAR